MTHTESDLDAAIEVEADPDDSTGQIAEDLARAGRQVFLATGLNGRVPRRYRGRTSSSG